MTKIVFCLQFFFSNCDSNKSDNRHFFLFLVKDWCNETDISLVVEIFYLKQHTYSMRVIITRGLFILHPLFAGQKLLFKGLYL